MLPLIAFILAGSVRGQDPCAPLAGKKFALAADAITCQKSFPFNETLRQNVMSVVSNVFDFFTFEDYYRDGLLPFQESTTNIRERLQELSTASFATDYEFNLALYNFTTQLNDGHTRWFPQCYNTYQNILPAPVTILADDSGAEAVYVIPDSIELLTQLGSSFTSLLSDFDWQRLAGAKILLIDGMDPFDYIDTIASTISGNYLDHGIRVNSVLSSYRIVSGALSQRIGDLAGPNILTQTYLSMTLTPVNATIPEDVNIPFIAAFMGANFTDAASYWKNNCAANNETNGVDLLSPSANNKTEGELLSPSKTSRTQTPWRAKASILDHSRQQAISLPPQFTPNLTSTSGSTDAMKGYVLPGNKTGVLFVGTFEPEDYESFQTDTKSALADILASGAENLIIDLHNNGGGFICLGLFLHFYLAGTKGGFPGFQSTVRANPLAQKIVAAEIEKKVPDTDAFYVPENWLSLNQTEQPDNFNYVSPPTQINVNGEMDFISNRVLDTCTPYAVDIPATPLFDLSKVKIVGNGNCASTCALFSSAMFERHGTEFAIFGAKPGEEVQIKGMAGNQVLEWADLDTEIKTAGLGNDSLAPPDLLVNGNMRVNWRTAWSFTDPNTPIAYMDEPAQKRFAYTAETYNNPMALWQFAEKELFGEV